MNLLIIHKIIINPVNYVVISILIVINVQIVCVHYAKQLII